MAFQSSDGQKSTNRSAMKMHESYIKRHSGAQMQAPHSEEHNAEAGEAQHAEMATCPNCGHQFEANPHEEQQEEQIHPEIHEQAGY